MGRGGSNGVPSWAWVVAGSALVLLCSALGWVAATLVESMDAEVRYRHQQDLERMYREGRQDEQIRTNAKEIDRLRERK